MVKQDYSIPWKEILQRVLHDRLALVLLTFNLLLLWYFYSLFMDIGFWSPFAFLLPETEKKKLSAKYSLDSEEEEEEEESQEKGHLRAFFSSLFQHHKNN